MSKNKKNLNNDRPFDAKILAQAKVLADQYELLIWAEDGDYYGHSVELPHVYADGSDPAVCIKAVREAMVGVIATMLENGEVPPRSARDQIRMEQINVRVSVEEKVIFESAAKRLGFKGLGDFARAAMLQRIG